jgi:hypothetical protein
MRGFGGDSEEQASACLQMYPDEANVASEHMVDEAIHHLNTSGTPTMDEILKLEYNADVRAYVTPDTTPLERLMIERLVLCKIELSSARRLANFAQMSADTVARDAHLFRRIDIAHRRYSHAIISLAQVRRIQQRSTGGGNARLSAREDLARKRELGSQALAAVRYYFSDECTDPAAYLEEIKELQEQLRENPE